MMRMRLIPLAVGILGILGCAAPQTHRPASLPEQPFSLEPGWPYAPPAWAEGVCSDTARPAPGTPREPTGPTAKLQFVSFGLADPEAGAVVAHLRLTSGPALLSNEQFTELLEAAQASGGVKEWPRVEVRSGSTAAIMLGWRSEENICGTAWYLRASDVTAGGANVCFAVQHVADGDNWVTEGAQELGPGQATAQLVTTTGTDAPLQGVAVRLASIENAVN